jgi:hypothetical protein
LYGEQPEIEQQDASMLEVPAACTECEFRNTVTAGEVYETVVGHNEKVHEGRHKAGVVTFTGQKRVVVGPDLRVIGEL